MKAVVIDRYGPPEIQRIEDVAKPVLRAGDILVRVRATTVNRTDCGWLKAEPFFARAFLGLRRPKHRVLRMEFAGVVDAVDAEVTEFAVGDEMFGVTGFGAHAEFVRVREKGCVAHKPADLTFEEAAAVPDGARIATACLARAQLCADRRILIYGATGSIGTAAVQLAKAQGTHVTAVCNGRNVDLLRSLGADVVLDYEKEDFTENGETYDVVFDSVGKHSFRRCRRSLTRGGTFLETDLGFMWHVPPLALATRFVGDKRVVLPVPKYTKQDVLLVKSLIEAGKYRPVVDRVYPLEEVVEATRYVETGQKVGNVVLTLKGADHESRGSGPLRPP